MKMERVILGFVAIAGLSSVVTTCIIYGDLGLAFIGIVGLIMTSCSAVEKDS